MNYEQFKNLPPECQAHWERIRQIKEDSALVISALENMAQSMKPGTVPALIKPSQGTSHD
jgi:hypothetical protein